MFVFEMIMGSSLVVKLIILVLFAMSVYSFSVFYIVYFKNKNKRSEINLLESVKDKNDSYHKAINSIINKIYGSELSFIFADSVKLQQEASKKVKNTTKKYDIIKDLCDITKLQTEKKITESYSKAESEIKMLATISSVAPYLGLLGTVIGIMGSFVVISEMSSVSLEYIAPSIAEALIVSAIGLFVAIPANIFYNKFMIEIDYFNEYYINLMNDLNVHSLKSVWMEKNEK